MEVYLCGGALRDLILGRTPKDFDLILRGATPQEMVAVYGDPTGQCFPVWRVGDFEVALPRLEKKVGKGYKGFQVQVDGHLPLVEEELGRRDFTVNALAVKVWEGPYLPSQAELEGAVAAALACPLDPKAVIDPFGGLADLRAGVLRAPYPAAFQEDPVRVLRAARFAARYGWQIEGHTLEAARRGAHELAHEPPERLWAEWTKAVAHDPARFLQALGEMGAFPHLRGLEWLGQARGLPIKNHEEDLFDHILMVVAQARRLLGPSLEGVTAALFHDAGKAFGLTPHDGKEAAERVVGALEALRAPRNAIKVAATWLRYHMAIFGVTKPGAVLDMTLALEKAGIDPAMAARLALADSLGRARVRPDAEERVAAIRDRLEAARKVAREITGETLIARGHRPGPDFGAILRGLRATRLAEVMR